MIFKDNLNILLIDDNLYETRLIKEILNDLEFKCNVHSLNTGRDALSFLNNQVKEGASIDLILLDLILPDISGMDVLKYVKSDSKLKLIPVVMVSVSKEQKKIEEAYKNNVNAYISKTIDYNDYNSALRSVISLYGLK